VPEQTALQRFSVLAYSYKVALAQVLSEYFCFPCQSFIDCFIFIIIIIIIIIMYHPWLVQ
jgi:hypothetical protein